MPRPLTAPVRKQVSLPPELAEVVETYRFDHRITSESAAIRELIELGLTVSRSKHIGEAVPAAKPGNGRRARG